MKLIFDSSALIPASKYAVEGKRICEHLVEFVEIHIPTAVQIETVVRPDKFASEAVLQELIAQRKIVVDSVRLTAETLEILAGYKLGSGEQEAILLYLHDRQKFEGVVLDDYVATIVCRRLHIGSLLLLDLIVQLARERLMPHDLAIAMIAKVAPRYNRGFIEHSLLMLGEQKMLLEEPPLFIKENLERYLAGKFPAEHLAPQEINWRRHLAQSYGDYAAGLVSLSWMAQHLQISTHDLDRIFEEMKLPPATGLEELASLWETRRASESWLKRSKALEHSLTER
ncbi:MAG: hypothetical protein ONB44_24065 [candidate division KSB1 bacterium]|nr:hypothetical protein [candidate division KSB1 bacterium]MDZ7305218.1 hypothetical protein [candidate division KSB1 bacterium]MDZ7314329.1 hypothetical protein [candidate division KSB1 bacterium]